MKSMLKSMKMKKNEIPQDLIPLFENIINDYTKEECESKFMKAMEINLSRNQRFRLCEQNGSCMGTSYDKERKAFAIENKDKLLKERLDLFTKTYGRKAKLNDDNTITVTFSCNHGYYKHAPNGNFKFSDELQIYFERCAGGRLYEYEKALGVKLKLIDVDISPLEENISNPVEFTFEVV